LSAIDSAEEDSRITSVILQKIMSDPLLSKRKIDVETRDQVVTLSGELRRPEERDRVVNIVENVGGVRRIEDRLRVQGNRGPSDISDDLIAAKLQERLLDDVLISGQSIRVESEGGIVTLRGKVDRPEQAERAVALARAVEGVRGVENHLQVRG
jgi:hyperosmotically inducible protein